MNIQKPNSEELKKPHADVNLEHRHVYVGGAFAYKNSRRKDLADPKQREASVLITGYGRARPVDVVVPVFDGRAGVNPDHNSPEDFQEELEIMQARSFDVYKDIASVEGLQKKKYKPVMVSFTKDRIHKVFNQFSHLSIYAFNQMMCITSPDKRDFEVWVKKISKTNQLITAFPHTKTNLTQFIQVIDRDKEDNVIGIKHILFDKGEPFVINESAIDKFENIRQIAHVGVKGGSLAKNAVERFDDATVLWTVTREKESGTAALKPNGEIIIIGKELSEVNMLAARNLGGEGLNPDQSWSGSFSLQACLAEDDPLQEQYKESVRKQIGQIVDGAAIPGLEPIFSV